MYTPTSTRWWVAADGRLCFFCWPPLWAEAKTAHWSLAFHPPALRFSDPHFMAAAYCANRAYDELTCRRFYTVHVALLAALAGLIAHVWYPAWPWIFTLYIRSSPWHYPSLSPLETASKPA